jgi:dTMP kinase
MSIPEHPMRSVFKPQAPFEKNGLLIAGEGPDGSGKTTIVKLLLARLDAQGHPTILSNWNETFELYNLMTKLNASGDLDNKTRFLFGAAELASRYHYVIRPALRAGTTVFVNKYLVSAASHASLRSIDPGLRARAYDFAIPPDLTLYFDVPVEIALERKKRTGIGFWEAGLDIALGLPLEECIRRYQLGEINQDSLEGFFLDFQRSLRQCQMVELNTQHPVLYLDSTRPPESVVEEAMNAINILRNNREKGKGVREKIA